MRFIFVTTSFKFISGLLEGANSSHPLHLHTAVQEHIINSSENNLQLQTQLSQKEILLSTTRCKCLTRCKQVRTVCILVHTLLSCFYIQYGIVRMWGLKVWKPAHESRSVLAERRCAALIQSYCALCRWTISTAAKRLNPDICNIGFPHGSLQCALNSVLGFWNRHSQQRRKIIKLFKATIKDWIFNCIRLQPKKLDFTVFAFYALG